MKTMTIKEAIKKGYSRCGSISQEWQYLTNIDELTEEDLKDSDYYLADKEPVYFTISEQEIKDKLSDDIGQSESDETGRDDDTIFDAIESLDFSITAEMINNKLREFPTYKITDIKLVIED